jgi:hypothetical protein
LPSEAASLCGEFGSRSAPLCGANCGSRQEGLTLAADRRLDRRRDPPSTIRQLRHHTLSGMDETQTLAVLALRELLDDPDRNDWDELVAANRELIKAIATGRPMTRRNARIVAEYLREAGWQEHAIGAATAQAVPTGLLGFSRNRIKGTRSQRGHD